MNQGIETIVYPVKGIHRAKQMFNRLLDAEPYADMQYYVGYKVGNLEIGLDPNGFSQGMTGPINYFNVKISRKACKPSSMGVHKRCRTSRTWVEAS